MDAPAFDESLGKALRLCRLAADLDLPIAEMLEHVADAIEAGMTSGLSQYGIAVEMLAFPPPAAIAELEALREIIAAVGDVAAIGAGLAGEEGANSSRNRPETAPKPPPEPTFPLPANLREA